MSYNMKITLIAIMVALFGNAIIASANDDIKKAAVDLTKHYGKEIIEQHINLNNNFIKYGGGIISTIKDEEINISINNTKINIQDNGIQIKKKWSF